MFDLCINYENFSWNKKNRKVTTIFFWQKCKLKIVCFTPAYYESLIRPKILQNIFSLLGKKTFSKFHAILNIHFWKHFLLFFRICCFVKYKTFEFMNETWSVKFFNLFLNEQFVNYNFFAIGLAIINDSNPAKN